MKRIASRNYYEGFLTLLLKNTQILKIFCRKEFSKTGRALSEKGDRKQRIVNGYRDILASFLEEHFRELFRKDGKKRSAIDGV